MDIIKQIEQKAIGLTAKGVEPKIVVLDYKSYRTITKDASLDDGGFATIFISHHKLMIFIRHTDEMCVNVYGN